jgi:hypothetical protein
VAVIRPEDIDPEEVQQGMLTQVTWVVEQRGLDHRSARNAVRYGARIGLSVEQLAEASGASVAEIDEILDLHR